MSTNIEEQNSAVAWTREFYSRSRERWGPSGILPHHRERAESVERLCGPGKKRILELGAGAGGTAAALADLGHDVTAIDIAPPSVACAAELARESRPGKLTVLEEDFFDPDLVLGQFDVVAYWNGFGIGTDADQKRLLARIAAEWLSPSGTLLLDVFNPIPWLRIAGQQKRVKTDRAGVCIEYSDFDPIGCRFLDSWIAEDEAREGGAVVHTQSIRCYSPADFLLLLEGTGLTICHAEVAGEPFDMKATGADTMRLFGDAWEYLVVLQLQG